MAPEKRELELRRRLAEYVERQAGRLREFDRLSETVARAVSQVEYEVPVQRADHAAGATGQRPWPNRYPTVTIAIPIHNAADELSSCLWSVARNTTYPARLLLLDDASTDPQIQSLLEWASGLGGVRILRNVRNVGFPATVNRALRAGVGDVVLLNSDTEVGPRWLEQLVEAAYSDPTIGTVTPLSDNAGAFSAPEIEVANSIPLELGPDNAARLVAAGAMVERPRAPTGNAFCMYIKRALIDAVGEMDAAGFERGYGEENDYCMRAAKLGWHHVVDPRTYVHHRRQASFGDAKLALARSGRRRMDELHPDYGTRVSEFLANEAMARARRSVADALGPADRGRRSRIRLLFVIHEGGGGSIATNRELMSALDAEYDCYCLRSDRRALRLRQIHGAEEELLQEWPLDGLLALGDFSRPDYRRALAAALERCNPELVHIRHLFKHTFDAPRLIGARNVPIVMSFHDHYFICPTIHLLDDQGRYCGGECTPGAGNCQTVRAGSLPVLKHAFVHQWREEVEAALESVDAFVTASEYTREIHQRFLAVTRDRPFELIEHGRDLTQERGVAAAPAPGGPIRILVLGHLDRHKGAELLRAMLEVDREGRLELHFLGDVPAEHRGLGTVHGGYERDTLAAHIRQIRPSFIGVFSATGESYSHAVTEAWASGIPVLATDLGAQAARVRARGGGFLVAHDDPAAALAQVFAAADDASAYAREAARATVADLPSVADMTRRYADLYRDVLDRRRAFATAPQLRTSPLRHGVWRISAIAGSAAGRSLRRFTHPGVQWKLRTTFVSADQEIPADAQLDLVRADALTEEQAERLVSRPPERDRPMVLLCDEAGAGEALLGAADLVIVPTRALASLYARVHAHVVVVPQKLDERLFLAGASADPPPAPPLDPDETIRLVFAATEGGAPEAQFVGDVVRELCRDGALRFELEIVGERDPELRSCTYRHIGITSPERDYATYARKLSELSGRWHLALAPVVGTAGADAQLRQLEYIALGLPTVASSTELLRTDNRVPLPALRSDAIGPWCETIRRLARDGELRAQLHRSAWAVLVRSHLMRQGARELLETLGRAFAEPLEVERTPSVVTAAKVPSRSSGRQPARQSIPSSADAR